MAGSVIESSGGFVFDKSLVVKVEYGVWEVEIAVESPSGKAMRLLGRKSRAAREAAPEGDRSEKRRQRPSQFQQQRYSHS